MRSREPPLRSGDPDLGRRWDGDALRLLPLKLLRGPLLVSILFDR